MAGSAGFEPADPTRAGELAIRCNRPLCQLPLMERAVGIEPDMGGLEGRSLTIRPSPQMKKPAGLRLTGFALWALSAHDTLIIKRRALFRKS